jgi:hypothetical protein
MNTTRKGKIARLSKALRHELNSRLEDGEPAQQLVAWLNGLPEVKKLLRSQFDGRPITGQNLSEWRQGGFLEWRQHEESCDRVRRLTEQAKDLQAHPEDLPVSDQLATLWAVELARLSEAFLGDTTDPHERWRRLRELLHELGQLRREDHQAARLPIEQDRERRQAHRLFEEKLEQDLDQIKRRACAPLLAAMQMNALAPLFGGGEAGRKLAAILAETQFDLEPGTLTARAPTPPPSPGPIQPNPTKSDQIQPNQTLAGASAP